MLKISKPIMFIGVGAIIVGIIFFATEPQSPAGTGKVTRKSTIPTKAKVKETLVQPEDYEAKFASLTENPKNVFKPLVVKSNLDDQLQSPVGNGIPSFFTGGDPNWRYTGSATVDGIIQAALENNSTGEYVFVREGETWKRAVIDSVQSESITMTGINGVTRTIRMGFNDPKAENVVPALPPIGQLPATGATPNTAPNPNSGTGRNNRGQGSQLTGPIGLEVRPIGENNLG